MRDILFNAKKAERHPLEMMLIAIFYSSISILVGSWIFPEYASLIAIFFTVMSTFYLTQKAIKFEEEKEENFIQEKTLLKEHSKALKLFTFIFIGMVISFAFWTYILPQETTSSMFSIQEKVLDQIKGEKISGNFFSSENIKIIFSNNLKVLLISFIISLIYGAGSLFVITWNASMMGFVIGSLARINGLISFPPLFTKYFLHGIPEMFSYLIAILAGGILYNSFFKGDLTDKMKTKTIITDVITLLFLAIIIMVFSALIEVFISPLI